MSMAAKIIISSVLFLGCNGQETESSCDPKNSGYARSNQDLEFLKKPPVLRLQYSNIVLVFSIDKTQKMKWCSGVIVGHNSALTAASCLREGVGSIYVVPSIYRDLYIKEPTFQKKLISMAVKPNRVITHGTMQFTDTIIEESKRPDDRAILLFADNTFTVENYDRSLIGSPYEGYPRPKIGQSAMTVGYGSERSDIALLKEKRGMYSYEESVLKDLLFYHDLEPVTPGSSVRVSRFEKTFEADRGAPLFTSLYKSTGEFILGSSRANIVGLLVHTESIKTTNLVPSGGSISAPTSSSMNVTGATKKHLRGSL
jgi:hypothetical protein